MLKQDIPSSIVGSESSRLLRCGEFAFVVIGGRCCPGFLSCATTFESDRLAQHPIYWLKTAHYFTKIKTKRSWYLKRKCSENVSSVLFVNNSFSFYFSLQWFDDDFTCSFYFLDSCKYTFFSRKKEKHLQTINKRKRTDARGFFLRNLEDFRQ